MAPPDLDIGAAGRPYAGEVVNGDAWQIDRHAGGCRLAVIDGLGHGPPAAAASDAACAALAQRPDLPPGQSLRLCHAALSGTRGAAISIAAIDASGTSLQYAGIGNVEGHLWHSGVQQRLMVYRGIVGAVLPEPRVFTFALPSGWLLVLHTDGIRARFRLDASPAEALDQAQHLADYLLAEWARPTDDAMVVVLRGI
ncbi:MAG TPA: SpoIIE family protein phosphatase [Chloroflexota bacterium]|nr:SpoIIE family protein phosphatase [Chloroflexota bacterium]